MITGVHTEPERRHAFVKRPATSRRAPVNFAACATGIAAIGTTSTVAKQAGAQPNILFILTDDMRSNDLAYMPAVQSQLVAQGVTLINFPSTNPTWAPARASILRGQYAHNHGVMCSKGDTGGIEQFVDDGDQKSATATWLQAAGIRNALVGKYIDGYGRTENLEAFPPGWDDWIAVTKEGYSRFEINER